MVIFHSYVKLPEGNVLVGFPLPASSIPPSFFCVEVGLPSKSEELSKIAKRFQLLPEIGLNSNFCSSQIALIQQNPIFAQESHRIL